MTEKQKQIQADIERHVAHMARIHRTTQDDIWREIYTKSQYEVTLKQ